jgi:hypothetical protein
VSRIAAVHKASPLKRSCDNSACLNRWRNLMSYASFISPFDPDQEDWLSKGSSMLARQLFDASELLRSLRVQMRFGQLSRAPLQLLRFQIRAQVVECDWLARPPDPWDADLPQSIQQQHVLLQTLKDAIDVRALLFDTLPQIATAYLRVYRESPSYAREMIITGCAQRNDNSSRCVHSLTMRAKVLGFRFNLEGDVLSKIPTAEQAGVGD